ncbi:MAG TPA: hypothetical protein VLW55_18035 [Burkholderiaceae bacterium]|nr:hypothetical protein [Burkholderiaceae bacterium]
MKAPVLILALASSVCSAAAIAQAPLDAPPPLPAATPPSKLPATPAPSNGPRRPLAQLPEAERARQDAAVPPPEVTTEPPDSELLPPARHTAPETRIEQKRQGNRVVEIIVTPQGLTSSYVIVNREGRPPLTTQELSSGLSTPRFLRFDF